MSETWLTNSVQMSYVQLPGYKLETKNRTGRRGGGVGMYILDDLNYKRRKDIENETDIENLWIQYKDMVIGVAYRPPSNNGNEWLEKLETTLQFIQSTWHGKIMLCGDMNFDLLKSSATNGSNIIQSYQNLLDTYNLTQHITKPTRTDQQTQKESLLDHIVTNMTTLLLKECVLPTSEISDHDCVFAIFNLKVKHYASYKFIRDEKQLKMENFVNDLKSVTGYLCLTLLQSIKR